MNKINVKDIIFEDFVNYKLPSMFIALGECDWKCCTEQGISCDICQNSKIALQKDIEIDIESLFSRYIINNISKSIVFSGLEPITRFEEIYCAIKYFRDNGCDDDIIIYTGYYDYEIQQHLDRLKEFNDIIVKFGRFIVNSDKKYDDVLGVELSSNNQYAERIS